MNRVTDSLDIWRQVVVSPLLYNVSLILFLNSEWNVYSMTVTIDTEADHCWKEMDILRYKIKSGVQIKNFFPNYKGHNEYEGASPSIPSLS